MSKSKTLLCQECERSIINRLVDNCLYCGADFPAELKLNKCEKDRIRKKEADAIKADRKARQDREDQGNSWGATNDPDLFFASWFFFS